MTDRLEVPNHRTALVEHPIFLALKDEVPIVRNITTYWVETIRGRREKALYEFLHDVAQEIEEIRDRTFEELDPAHVASEEYSDTLASVSELAIRERDATKLEYLKRFIVNYGKRKRPDITMRKVFSQYIRELSGLHLMILSAVFGAQRQLSDADLEVLTEQGSRSEAVSIERLKRELETEEGIVEVLAATLRARALVRLVDAAAGSEDASQRLVMTPVARLFMGFLES